MLGNCEKSSNGDGLGRTAQELSIEKACEEYKNSVKLTLTLINHQLDDALTKNYNGLDELAVKIAARSNFLEKNPSFLSCLYYHKRNIKSEPLLEFDELKIILKEHSRRIQEKIEEVELHHKKLVDLVMMNGKDEIVQDELQTMKTTAQKEGDDESDFQDCLDKPLVKEEIEMRDVEAREGLKVGEKCKFSYLQDLIPAMPNPEPIKPSPDSPPHPHPKKSSYGRVTIQKNAYSDMSLSSVPGDPPLKFQLFPDIPPDVQRRRPQEDLHGKLIQQLEATDSLEGFLKLMERKPSLKRKVRARKGDNLEQKYTGSLWFFPPKGVKGKISKNAIASKSTSQKCAKIEATSASTCCNLLVTSSQPCPLSNEERMKKVKLGLGRTKLRCYDLLDDIDCGDIQPIKSEYPRRDNIAPMKLQEAKTYLHRMMLENEKVWKKLLQPIDAKRHQLPAIEAKKPAVPTETKKIPPETKELKKKQSNEVKKKQLKAKNVKNLIEYLTAPEQKFLSHIPHSLIVMPVKIIYDNFPTKDNTESPRGAVLITDLTKAGEPIRKQEGRFLQTKAPDYSRSSPFPMQRKKEMLDQLRGLKLRNDNIQKNIQKAIDVIESKMIDLLSSPNDASSSEAFNAMEEEITKVLKMMSDSEEKKDKNEKVEPEKDENGKSAPKIKRQLTTVKKSLIVDLKPGAGDQSDVTKPEVEAKEEEQLSKTKQDKKSKEDSAKKSPKEESKKCLKEENEKPIKKAKEETKKVGKEDCDKKKKEETVKKTKEDSSILEKVKKQTKASDEEVKKAANIEEGERLLGQVDSVIRKIDSIYTKFYDETKTKGVQKQDSNFSNVIDFVDGLKQIIEPPPIEIEYKSYEDFTEIFQEPSCYCQTFVYYGTLLQVSEEQFLNPLNEEIDLLQEEFEQASAQEIIETKAGEVQTMGVTILDATILNATEETQTKTVKKRHLFTTDVSTYQYSVEKRHDYTLKAFYTLFFSSIFVALNFDYAS